jgi:hypothetical protein
MLAAEGLAGGDRLLTLHAGMDTQERERIKAAFQAEPSASPVRILLATDAASEGIDLQNHCAADPLRDPMEPEPHGAAQRAHRPPRPEGRRSPYPPLCWSGIQRSPDRPFTVNMELGVLVSSGPLPGQVERHFDELMQEGVLARV